MNVLKAIKNIKTRHLIEIDVDSLTIIHPTKIVVTSSDVRFHTGTYVNKVDIRLSYNRNIIYLNDIEKLSTSIKHDLVTSVDLYQTMALRTPPYTKTCEIKSLHPLNNEQCQNLISFLNGHFECPVALSKSLLIAK